MKIFVLLLLLSFLLHNSAIFGITPERKIALERAQVTFAMLNSIDQQIQYHCPTLSPRLRAILRNEILRELMNTPSLISKETIGKALQKFMSCDLEKIHADREATLQHPHFRYCEE